jgi:hypothetical protein
MNREEEIGAFTVGDRRAFGQRHEVVGAARQDHVDARHLLEQFLDPHRDVEHELRFGNAFPFRTRVVTAMTGVDDDARHAEPELPRDREAASRRDSRQRRAWQRRRRCRRRGWHDASSRHFARG